MKRFLFVLFILGSLYSSAQKIHGIVYNEQGDLLPYASVTIKGTTIGASANNRAKFSIAVSPGTYTVVCQHIGYTAQEKKITIVDIDEELVFVLKEQELDLKEVVIKKGEDPAYAIIRQAIKKRPYYDTLVKAFECDLYTKNIVKLRHMPKKILGKKIPEEDIKEMQLDSSGKGIIYLSESVSKISSERPDKFKLQVLSSRVSGSDSYGFTFPTFIGFYENNVSVFAGQLNPRGFISPIADGAINFYKFRYLGSFWEDGKEINSILVIPRRKFEPLFSGTINITEGDWRIHSVDLTLTPNATLEILDTLQVTQFYVPINNEVWGIKNQLLHFNFQKFGIDAIGNFVNVYSQYNLEPVFPKKLFNNVVIKYDTAASKRPKSYWDTIRPMPLEKEETKDYQVKDSIYEQQRDSAMSKSTIDSLKKKQGPIKLYKIFWNGIDRTHYSQANTYTWGIDPLLQKLEYNPAEGLVVNVNGHFNKYLKKWKTNLAVDPVIRYGFSNTHLCAWADIIFRTRDYVPDKKLRRQRWIFSGGKRVVQFNKDGPILQEVNSISTLFSGNNFMKTYENYFGAIGYARRFESGLGASINILYEDRIPLNNTTDFTLFKRDTIHITPNYPYEKINAQFLRHQAFMININLSIKPGQKYIEFPDSKMSLGSKYPTFTLNYTKGFKNILGSDVDFDKWKFTISDWTNLKLAGLLKYKLSVGGFLNTNAVFIQDYKHFNGNESFAAGEYLNSFQLARYYTYSNTDNLYFSGHLEHHFNGLITNRIPLFNRLKWNLVAGSNGFYVNQKDNYVELFVGLENILKLFRVDFVTAYENGRNGMTGIKLGAGGVLGSSINAGSRNNNAAFGF